MDTPVTGVIRPSRRTPTRGPSPPVVSDKMLLASPVSLRGPSPLSRVREVTQPATARRHGSEGQSCARYLCPPERR